MIRKLLLPVALLAWLAGAPAVAAAADYHHIHLVATSAAEAKAWYMTHMGCTDYGRANACAAGDTLIIFFEREPTGPSVGSGVDHIGFSFTDLAAKMASFEAADVKILNPIREIDGLFKLRLRRRSVGHEDRGRRGHRMARFPPPAPPVRRSRGCPRLVRAHLRRRAGQPEGAHRRPALRHRLAAHLPGRGRAGADRGPRFRPPRLAVPGPARRRRGDQGQGRRVRHRATALHQPSRRGHADLVRDRTGRRQNRDRPAAGVESSRRSVNGAEFAAVDRDGNIHGRAGPVPPSRVRPRSTVVE